jgi:hypothetical protein
VKGKQHAGMVTPLFAAQKYASNTSIFKPVIFIESSRNVAFLLSPCRQPAIWPR